YLLRRALFMPWEATSILDPATVAVGLEKLQILENLQATVRGLRQPRSRIAALEFSWYLRNQLLRDSDWAGMAHSLEIRVPLVDFKLLGELAPGICTLLPGEGKLALASAPSLPLQDEVVTRIKTGFSVPTAAWMDAAAGALQVPPSSAPEAKGLVSRRWSRLVLGGPTLSPVY